MRYSLKAKIGEANAAICLACVVFTLFYFMAPVEKTQLLVGDSYSIYDGKYWVLISSVVFHGSGMHLIFNLMWLWQLGNVMEEALGSFRYVAFVIGSAFVSSGFQLISTVGTGIGISGVICAIAGFMWAARRDVSIFGLYMPDRRLSRFIAILVLMIPLDHFIESISIGHHAHFGGLAFGLAVGRASSKFHTRWEHIQGILGVVVMVGFVSTSLIWAPWSKSWNVYQVRKGEVEDFQNSIRILEDLEYQMEKRRIELIEELIAVVNDASVPTLPRLEAVRRLGEFRDTRALDCLIANITLGDDGERPVDTLPVPKALREIGKVGTTRLLDELQQELPLRKRVIVVKTIVTLETLPNTRALIEKRLSRADGKKRQALSKSLDVLQ